MEMCLWKQGFVIQEQVRGERMSHRLEERVRVCVCVCARVNTTNL